MRFLFFALITLSASLLGDIPGGSFFVVWNVGQGQWASAINADSCQHFDMGGEFFPWKKIYKQCRHKQNTARLSHWDWDHIGALNQKTAAKSLKNLCLVEMPLGKSSPSKMKMLKSYPLCPILPTTPAIPQWTPSSFKNSNDRSRVYTFRNFLIPGDSTAVQEKMWGLLPWVSAARVLILGHHGSKTSTSEDLLRRLPRLKMAVSSARWGRYRHPHSDVEARLRQARVALLRTEDWGNLWFESP